MTSRNEAGFWQAAISSPIWPSTLPITAPWWNVNYAANKCGLRQKSLEFIAQPDRLVKLMLDSVSTFCALSRHALILAKRPAKWKKQEILSALSDATGSPLHAANQLLAIRESGKKPAANAAIALLDDYLKDTDVMVSFVDGLEK